jgi:hypothetical protein
MNTTKLSDLPRCPHCKSADVIHLVSPGGTVNRECMQCGKKFYAPMNIRTEHVYPPIPNRNYDWSAVDGDTYDGPGSPIGTGATEADAVSDLQIALEQRLLEQEWGHRRPRSKTEVIHGDGRLTTFINAADFLQDEDEIKDEIPEPPDDEGQCQ